MMDEKLFRNVFDGLPLGGVRYFEKTTSTNDIALAWAAEDAPNLALVYAEEQTAGRGRGSRHWFTPPGTGLAFSLVLRPASGERSSIPLYSALGALAVCDALVLHGLKPEIKWPNDVLLNQHKVCGILAETVWLGDKLAGIVLGGGLNIKPAAVPPVDQLNFPATCLEAELSFLEKGFDTFQRLALLRQILQAVLNLRSSVGSVSFLQAWENRLAFRGQMVEIWADQQVIAAGMLDGLERDGRLRLVSATGQILTVQAGEMHLRTSS